MVKERPDWCISRQRKWGVPIAIFIHKDTNKPLSDIKVFDNVVKAIETEGVEIWFKKAESFLPKSTKKIISPVYDVIDVWFDSGRTYSYVLSKRG